MGPGIPPTGGTTMPDPGHVARIILDQPGTGNALDEKMSADIVDACDRIAADDEVSVVLLTGAGAAFCRGGDTGPYKPVDALAALDRPVIAGVNGPCLGVGLEL